MPQTARPHAQAVGEVSGDVRQWVSSADEVGGYELRDLPPGRYTVVTSLYEPAVVPVKLDSAARVDVDVHLASPRIVIHE